jgi:primosomal protein N' (replication factor Y)
MTADPTREDTAPGVIKVVLDAPLRAPFDYLPPSGLPAETVPIGARVRVPLGRRETVGWVVGHADQSTLAAEGLKSAYALLDAEALLDEEVLRLLRWAADYYHHALGELLSAAVPKALREGRPSQVQQHFWLVTPAGTAALESGQCARAPRQLALLRLLAGTEGGLSEEALEEQMPRWRPAARQLRVQGWLERQARAIQAASLGAGGARDVLTSMPAPTLSAEQTTAVAQIDADGQRFAAHVLRGVTGSGKTEVYLQCAERTLARGRGVLMLVPEIALTAQLIERVRQRLPVSLSVLHSGLSDSERLSAWRAARSGDARVVLGTRSAIFAPLARLGLIIVDEEHDSSYKQQEGGCRYSARDLAVVRAQQRQIPVVLGSATPSFETLLNVQSGRYRQLTLPRRSDQAAPALLKLIDLRAHAVRHGLSTPVVDAIRRHLREGSQVLVFINRRGYAPTLLCTACGWLAACEHCDARLTVHQARAELLCHHCGARRALPERCGRCGGSVKPVGQGTERVEATLQELFPETALLRLDRDTASDPAELDSILGRIRRGEARILVGTQMITKGHHFPGVLLVVVLNADQGLFSTDFRASERLAQTIVQVAGRAGREQTQGEVLIQTEFPEHPLLQALLAGGYDAFAASALSEREAARWPPFARLALLRASSVERETAVRFLSAARSAAPQVSGVQVLGPVDAAMARRAGRYYAQLLIESPVRAALHRFIDEWLPQVDALARGQRVRYALDVDPIDIG